MALKVAAGFSQEEIKRRGANVCVLLVEALSMTWRNFTKDTSIHGLKYTTGRRMLDRWVWTAMVLGCASMAGVLVVMLSYRYLSNPTRTVYKTQHQPISAMHFPAVSLCAPRKITQYAIHNLMSKLKVPSSLTEEQVSHAIPQLLGFVFPIPVDEETLRVLDAVLLHNDLDTEAAMLDLAPPCGDIIVRCRWKGRDVPCASLFKRAKTYVGYCCTFNYNSNVKGVPFESFTTEFIGSDMGLSFVVDTFIDEFLNQVYHKMDTFKVLIHSTESYAGRFSDEILLAQRKEILLACVVQSLGTGPQASRLDPGSRHCLLPHEQSLRYFQMYNKDNCLLECEIEECMKRCGCLPFMYPRFPGETLCNASSIPCVMQHFKAVLKDDWASVCHCSRQCNQNITNVDVYSTHMKAHSYNPDPFYYTTTENQSMVHVFHARQVATVIHRTIYTHWVDLMSSFGGMFNLFLGCSFISILEFFYFFLVRFPKTCVALYRRNNNTSTKLFALTK